MLSKDSGVLAAETLFIDDALVNVEGGTARPALQASAPHRRKNDPRSGTLNNVAAMINLLLPQNQCNRPALALLAELLLLSGRLPVTGS